MVQPVNLNRYRKQKALAEDKANATENTVRFGRTKAQQKQERDEAEKSGHDLDGHKQDP
jgi:hypothetical protein